MQPAAPRQYTPNLHAYEALLRARHHFNTLTPESMARGRECLEQAIALDQGYALAYNELGFYFSTLAGFGMMPAHEAAPLARAAVQQALKLDPLLPEALATLGRIAALYDYDWTEAERLFNLAMSRIPVSPGVRQLRAFYLLAVGRLTEAIQEFERALQEDPLNPYSRAILAFCFLAAGREADAARECRRILELNDENYYLAYFFLSMIHLQQGKLEEAVAAAEKAHSLAPWYTPVIGYFAGLLERTGNAVQALTIFQKLADRAPHDAPRGFVLYHVVRSEIDLAADWAEKANEQRSPTILWFLRLPLAMGLRRSARWPRLAKLMNLPEGV